MGTKDPSKKAPGSNQEEPQRDRKKKRCRSRLKSSSFPSQCWLDSRSPCSGLDSGVCGAVSALPQAQPTPPLTLTFALSASSLEEETYPTVGLSLNTDIGFDLGDTLNTPTTTNTTESTLDGFLADTEMMAMADSEK